MAAKKKTKTEVPRIKSFTNVDEVFDKMLEFGFFSNERHMEERKAELRESTENAFSNSEHWYSNGAEEFKIFRGLFGCYEICNFRSSLSEKIVELFEVAEMPKP